MKQGVTIRDNYIDINQNKDETRFVDPFEIEVRESYIRKSVRC